MMYSRAVPIRRPAVAECRGLFGQYAPGDLPVQHGLGQMYDLIVPTPTLSIRDKAIASWPPAWRGQNLRDIQVSLGYDVDTPWQALPE